MDDFDAMSEIEVGDQHRESLGWIEDPERRWLSLRRTIDQFAMRGQGLFGIELVAEGQDLIGYCGLLQSDVAEGKDVELVCSLLERYWKQGLACETCLRVIEWGLDELGLPRILSRVAAGNEASRRLVDRLRMSLICERVDPISRKREQVFAAVQLSGGMQGP